MMQSMARGGGMPGMPGMGGMPGMPGAGGRRPKGKQQAKKGKGKGKRVSGNPAKRAEQAKATPPSTAASANPFGAPAGGDGPADLDPADLQLPDELAKFLPRQ